MASLLESISSDIEVLVLDAIQYGDPWNIAEEGVRFLVSSSPNTPMETLNQGIREANAPILYILFPGTQPSEGGIDAALHHFSDRHLACLIPTILEQSPRRRVLALGSLYRPNGEFRSFRSIKSIKNNVLCIAPHMAAAFFRREPLLRIGGFNTAFSPPISYMDAAIKLQRLGQLTLLETEYPVCAQVARLPVLSSFSTGRQAELLYRFWSRQKEHWLKESPTFPKGSLTKAGMGSWQHFLFMQAEFWKAFPSFSALARSWGRFTTYLAAWPAALAKPFVVPLIPCADPADRQSDCQNERELPMPAASEERRPHSNRNVA